MKHKNEEINLNNLKQNIRLQTYANLLSSWQKKINLVSGRTLDDLWTRHILDSAQILSLLPKQKFRLLDMGSGAGFPGMIIAILNDYADVTLVESDGRKVAFLQEVARVTETKVTLCNQRIEKLEPQMADVICARALAPISQLLEWGEPHLASGGFYIFLKGSLLEEELTVAMKSWHINQQRVSSQTHPEGQILLITKAVPLL